MDFAPLLGSVSFLAGWPDSAGRPHFSATRPQSVDQQTRMILKNF